MPELRRLGFRAAVVRPFDAPETAIARQLSEQLIAEGSEPLSATLDLSRLRGELAPPMTEENIPFLFLLIDQAEDVVSPVVPPEAKEQLVDFLQQVWHADERERPAVKAPIAYRTDSDSRLEPLWKEVSGLASGLPYHTVRGLTKATMRQVLQETAEQVARGISPPRIGLRYWPRRVARSMPPAMCSRLIYRCC